MAAVFVLPMLLLLLPLLPVDYYWRFTFYLPFFAGENTRKVSNSPNQFTGCGGNTVWDLTEVQLRNDWGDNKWMCIDRLALV